MPPPSPSASSSPSRRTAPPVLCLILQQAAPMRQCAPLSFPWVPRAGRKRAGRTCDAWHEGLGPTGLALTPSFQRPVRLTMPGTAKSYHLSQSRQRIALKTRGAVHARIRTTTRHVRSSWQLQEERRRPQRPERELGFFDRLDHDQGRALQQALISQRECIWKAALVLLT
jgi:hypothetical protein